MNRTTLHDILLYTLAYALLLITMVVCLAAVLEFRLSINVLWAVMRRSPYTLGLADQLSLLVGGLLAFVYTVFLEGYYRNGVTQRGDKDLHKSESGRAARPRGRVAQWLMDARLDVLLRRFAWTVAIPGGVLIVSLAMRPILFGLLR